MVPVSIFPSGGGGIPDDDDDDEDEKDKKDEGKDDKRSPHPHDSPLAGGKNWRRSLAAQLQDSFRCLKPG